MNASSSANTSMLSRDFLSAMPQLYPRCYTGGVSTTCETCGGPIKTFPSRIARGNGKFCSRPCAHEARRGVRRPEMWGRSGVPRRPLEDRFWEKVDKSGTCWLWTAAKYHDGYGMFGVTRSTPRRASRVAFGLAFGAFDESLDVLHTCDTPACVRYDEVGVWVVDGVEYPRRGHLFLGTNKVNAHDMLAKGRERVGERAGRSKLKSADIPVILLRLSRGETQTGIAADHLVSQSLISQIACGAAWKKIDRSPFVVAQRNGRVTR